MRSCLKTRFTLYGFTVLLFYSHVTRFTELYIEIDIFSSEDRRTANIIANEKGVTCLVLERRLDVISLLFAISPIFSSRRSSKIHFENILDFFVVLSMN